MSYCLDINSPLVRSESDFFRLLDGLFYCFTRPVIFKWSTTQVCTMAGRPVLGFIFSIVSMISKDACECITHRSSESKTF